MENPNLKEILRTPLSSLFITSITLFIIFFISLFLIFSKLKIIGRPSELVIMPLGGETLEVSKNQQIYLGNSENLKVKKGDTLGSLLGKSPLVQEYSKSIAKGINDIQEEEINLELILYGLNSEPQLSILRPKAANLNSLIQKFNISKSASRNDLLKSFQEIKMEVSKLRDTISVISPIDGCLSKKEDIGDRVKYRYYSNLVHCKLVKPASIGYLEINDLVSIQIEGNKLRSQGVIREKKMLDEVTVEILSSYNIFNYLCNEKKPLILNIQNNSLKKIKQIFKI